MTMHIVATLDLGNCLFGVASILYALAQLVKLLK